MSEDRVGFLYLEDTTEEEIAKLSEILHHHLPLNYTLILTSHRIETISRDELLRLLKK